MPAFLFTDIEGSTQLWEEHPQLMAEALQRHDAILYQAVEKANGQVVEHTGDGIFAVFEEGNPLLAAIDMQRQLTVEEWGELGTIKVRIGITAADADRETIDYFAEGNLYRGPVINEAARVTAIGWGGQILITPKVLHHFVAPQGTRISDMGAHVLRSITQLRQIYSISHPDLPQQTFPPLRSLSVRPNNLPPQETAFLGREKELKDIVHRLEGRDCRLLTIMGLGGVGKTRLAIQAAAEAIELFPNGVFFVPLASINSADFIVSTIAKAVDFSFYSGSNQKLQLLNYLREKKLLLVMDNAEHVLDGVALVNEILEAAPQVNIVVTSREWLNLPNEQRLRIYGMALPGEDHSFSLQELSSYSAIELFLQAARRARPDFGLTRGNQEAVVRICRLVGGMPLGIELAAAWVSAFSCVEIAQQIKKNLEFLNTDKPEVTDRQRSLYAICDYFWNQLSASEQRILRRLSLLRGGFTTGAAREVAGASFFFLSALLDRAFLSKTKADGPYPMIRYEIHEVLRHYAYERMLEHPEERDRTLDRHAFYYARFLQEHEAALKDERQEAALARIHSEIDNLRAAWSWTIVTRDLSTVNCILPSLYLIYSFLGWYEEGIELFAMAVEALQADATDDEETELLLARLQARQARFYHRTSQLEVSEQLLQQSYEVARRVNQHEEMAFCLHYLGVYARITGRFEQAVEQMQESIALYRTLDKRWELALVLSCLAENVYRLGRYEEAREYMWESYVIRQKLGDPRSLASTLEHLGVFLKALGEPEGARVLLQGGLNKHKSIANNQWRVGTATLNLGVLAFDSGDYVEAKRYYQRSLSIFRDLGTDWSIAAALDNLGQVAFKLDDLQKASLHFREALQVAQRGKVVPIALDVLVGVAHLLAAREQKMRALQLLSFVLEHPRLDRAETEKRAQKFYTQLRSDLSLHHDSGAVVSGAELTLEDVIADMSVYLEEMWLLPSELLY